jgi:hypothetical protein
MRAERRFRPTDPVALLADFVEAEHPDGMRGATLATVYPRREVAVWSSYDLARLETPAHFAAFEAAAEAKASGAASVAAAAAASAARTLESIGLVNREVLHVTRAS